MNPILECPSCGHQFRVTPTRVFDPQNETLCAKCGYHSKGIYFEVSRK
jgi:Zn ribbon nucleic-acid-binding protein